MYRTIANRPPSLAAFGRGCAALSLILVPLDSLGVSLGSVQLRLYMIPALGVILAALLSRRKHRSPSLIFRLLWIFTVLVLLSLAWTISVPDTLQVGFGQLFLCLWGVSVLRLVRAEYITFREIARWLGIGLAISAVFAILQVLLYVGIGTNLGVWTSTRNVPWPRPNGLTREPVWAAFNATLGLALTLVPGIFLPRQRRWLILLFAVVVVLTFSRASIIVCVLLIILAVLSPGADMRGGRRAGRMISAGLLGCALVVVAIATAPTEVFARFNIVAALQGGDQSTDQGSLSSRVGVQQLILDAWPEAPAFGHGAGSIAAATSDAANQAIYAGGGELNTGRGSTNFFLTSLYDLGLVGLMLVILLWLVIIGSAWLVRRRCLVPLLMMTTLLITFQASNGFRLGVAWASLALIAACLLEFREQSNTTVGLRRDRGVVRGRVWAG